MVSATAEAIKARCPFEVVPVPSDTGYVAFDFYNGERLVAHTRYHRQSWGYEPFLLPDMILAHVYYQAIHG